MAIKEFRVRIMVRINISRFLVCYFETDEFYYVTQISHPQQRHINMKANLDFKKLYNPKDNRLIAVVNLNYMFPIKKSDIVYLEFKKIDSYRTFTSDKEKSKYIDLLKTELDLINKMHLENPAKRIYENKYAAPNSPLAKRCLDFKKIEVLCRKYN